MSGLLFLTAEDFAIQQGANGNILCHNIPDFSLILFYSTHCVHCQGLIPIFKRLPGSIGGCQFGMINVSANKACVSLSKNTIAPISYVPYIVLYINGKPFMVYKGPYDEGEIRRFVIEVANNVQQKRQFSKEKVKQEPDSGIPAYTIGKPITGGKDQLVCYLTFEEFMTPKEEKMRK
jgi:thiol-disulfide isomerase/thioredoxin